MVGKMINIQLTNKKKIFNYCSPYIIAEIGANHNGDMNLAKKMIDSAIKCGCDAVKFQSWSNKSLVSNTGYKENTVFTDSKKKHFGSLKEMIDKYYLRKEQHFELKNYCTSKEVDFCSTPFSLEEIDLLNELNVEFFKVASMDINNYSLIKYLAQFNKPILLSTGMASLGEIEKAVRTIEKEGNFKIVILHCVAIYPPENKDLNLNNITMLQNTFGYPVGFSDHSLGFAAPLASVALGACVIEKHFTTDKDLPGWDHEISANPDEMKNIVDGSRTICESLGNFQRIISKAEEEKKKVFRRSVISNKDLKSGDIIGEEDISFKRPGTGITIDELNIVLGRRLKKNIDKDELIKIEDLD